MVTRQSCCSHGCSHCRSNATQPTGLGRQRGSRAVELHGIVVHGQNGTVYDLSSAFRPEVDEYGASVPPAFVNGSLCILPGNGVTACPVTAENVFLSRSGHILSRAAALQHASVVSP